MKKKILSLFIILGAFFVVLFSVKALTAKAPESIPSAGTDVYGVVDSAFDYSKIKFTTSTGGTTNGKRDLRKIRLATGYNVSDITVVEIVDGHTAGGPKRTIVLNSDWFSAYCLDPTLRYPDSGLAYQSSLNDNPNAKTLFEFSVLTALMNQANVNTDMYDLIATLRGLIFSEMQITVPSEYMEGENIKYEDIVNALYNSGTTSIDINVSSLTYVSATSNPTITEITAAQLNTAAKKTGDTFVLTLTRDNVLYNQYRAVSMSSSKTSYNWALWIIEHSYPTLTMDRMFADIGVSKDALAQELITLESLTDVTEAEADALIENYVYATIQYAIWKSTGSKVDGVYLGSDLQGSTELNKIYKYFIEDRGYANYGTEKFKTEITLVKPNTSSEIAEETSTTIKYGPYSFNSSMLTVEKINISTTATSGVKLLNMSGVETSSVKVGESFFVLVDKNHNQTQITINAETVGGYTFEPSSNRGRIYYAHDPLTQTVGTGGIIKSATATVSFDIMINVKTGIANLALVFVISLLVFSLGYLYIAYRNKPIEL